MVANHDPPYGYSFASPHGRSLSARAVETSGSSQPRRHLHTSDRARKPIVKCAFGIEVCNAGSHRAYLATGLQAERLRRLALARRPTLEAELRGPPEKVFNVTGGRDISLHECGQSRNADRLSCLWLYRNIRPSSTSISSSAMMKSPSRMGHRHPRPQAGSRRQPVARYIRPSRQLKQAALDIVRAAGMFGPPDRFGSPSTTPERSDYEKRSR